MRELRYGVAQTALRGGESSERRRGTSLLTDRNGWLVEFAGMTTLVEPGAMVVFGPIGAPLTG